jgi:phytanoyl-CoA dioxygenase PhyH
MLAISPDDDIALCDHAEQLTLEVAAGDAVVLDYRLLHGTHANKSDERRDCVLLSFAPAWQDLPAELRAHLIRHPALPGEGGHGVEGSASAWPLPSFGGTPRDLALNRDAPRRFDLWQPRAAERTN